MNKIVEMEKSMNQGTESQPTVSELNEAIRNRAYELYEFRGREDGHDLDDWLQAEMELTGRRTATA